jgi:3',5'-cyclic AMP phosphodiesterase CpdA
MTPRRTIRVLSDVHFASAAEQQRRGHESRAITNPVLRALVMAYRHFVWLRDPFAHNHLLDAFLARRPDADLVVVNGDLSCDTAFVGLSDDAAYESARQCLAKLRGQFGDRLVATLGDHELGKLSLFGGRGGLRLSSWERLGALGLESLWRREVGGYVLLGVTSTLLAFPVFEADSLAEERAQWQALREAHLAAIREVFAGVSARQRVVLFCHDPTALPFLWREEVVRARVGQIELTIIGHLHSNLILWKSRMLAGLPPIRFLGHSVRRMSTALSEARLWRPFNVRLCPSLAGLELLHDGGYAELGLDPRAVEPARFQVHRLPRQPAPESPRT